jgi:hypothetical protein
MEEPPRLIRFIDNEEASDERERQVQCVSLCSH